jgi:hypothetical protein
MMQTVLAVFLTLWSGWIIAAQFSALFAISLNGAIAIAPFSIAGCALAYLCARRATRGCDLPSSAQEVAGSTPRNNPGVVAATIAIPVILLHFSWFAFWLSASVALGLNIFWARRYATVEYREELSTSALDKPILLLLAAVCVIWTLSISRPDLDDAFYVGVAAFVRTHPHFPLLQADPMFGEQNWPLLFPSYKMSAYEVLGGAVAYVTQLSAMDAMYRILPPVFSGLAVVSTALFAREIAPRRWLLVTVVAILLIGMLGETHRGFANFGFDRIFQGKAIFVTLPSIYYLTWKLMREGRPDDWLLLIFAQLGAIGLSGFAMLIAPIAGLSALLASFTANSNIPRRRLGATLITLLVPAPYLIWVAVSTHDGASFSALANEPPINVWTTVFGPTQQYLVATLMLAGPAFASNYRAKVLLAAPWFILLAIFLNPFLATLISSRITTPLVYWRCVWLLPALALVAVAMCETLHAARSKMNLGNPAVYASALMALLIVLCLPQNSFRAQNQVTWSFNSLKVPPADLAVARKAVSLTPTGSRLLAPDPIAGIVAALDQHPSLVTVRQAYLDQLATFLGMDDYTTRTELARFSSGRSILKDSEVREASQRLKVDTIVLSNNGPDSAKTRDQLKLDYCLAADSEAYSIWLLKNGALPKQCNMDTNQ